MSKAGCQQFLIIVINGGCLYICLIIFNYFSIIIVQFVKNLLLYEIQLNNYDITNYSILDIHHKKVMIN